MIEKRKPIPDFKNIGWGVFFADFMLEADYKKGKWQEPTIKPYGSFKIEPSMCCLHYGQSCFEGQKAYKRVDGGLNIFRPMDNFARLNKSHERMCMPELSSEYIDELFIGLKTLLQMNKDFVPDEKDGSLYIRMHTFANENFIGLRPSDTYKLFIICSPVPPYLNGFAPTKLMIPEHYTRASIGGTGEAKSAGNYDGTLVSVEEAHKLGYSNCLFLRDGGIITECSAANIFFVIKDKIVTPQLDGSILHGITRDSVIKLAKSHGFEVEEKIITINDLMFEAYHGNLKEILMTGTAACVIPVSELLYRSKVIKPEEEVGYFTEMMYMILTGIQYSRIKDPFDWVTKVI